MLLKQKSQFTLISKEYPVKKGDPYYPINDKRNSRIFAKYKKLMNNEKKNNVFFEGRLANYKYLNTDEVIEKALELFDEIKKKLVENLAVVIPVYNEEKYLSRIKKMVI